MNQRITSTQNPKIKQLRKIFNDKNSEFFIVEGYHLVEEVLKENLVIKLYELDSKTAKYDNSIIVSDNVLKAITKTKTPEGIVALCRKKSNTSELGNRVVFLDNVQDPGNVGTIIRAAKSFNFDTVVSNANFYNDKIVRSSQGSLFTVNLVNYTYDDLHSILKKYKQNGFKIYCTSLSKNSVPINKISFENEKILIIFGNEGSGVSETSIKIADKLVYVPIDFESLNVAVCAGIVLYEANKKAK